MSLITVIQTLDTSPVIDPISTVVVDSGAANTYEATVVNQEGGSLTYLWTWGDSTTSSTATPSKTYAAAGTYSATLLITDAQGSTATVAFTVVVWGVPTISSVAPVAGGTAGGTSVVITGTNFKAGTTALTGAASVKFGAVNAISYVVNSATQITAVAPAGSAGAVTVVVTNPNDAATASNAFTYEATPTITSLSPVTDVPAGGATITVTGTGFLSASAVTVDGTPLGSFTPVSATSLTFAAPAHAAGAVNVTVTNATGTSTAAVLTYEATPTISALSPDTDVAAGGATITVTGTGFLSATSVSVDGTPLGSFTPISATSLSFVAPAHGAGAVDVVVTNPAGTSTAATLTYT